MLHSPVYNDCLTPELSVAWREQNLPKLISLVRQYAEVAQQCSDEDVHLTFAKLQVACALVDAMKGGHACCFVTDFVNV